MIVTGHELSHDSNKPRMLTGARVHFQRPQGSDATFWTPYMTLMQGFATRKVLQGFCSGSVWVCRARKQMELGHL